MSNLPVFEKPPPVGEEAERLVLRAARKYAKSEAEFEMFADQLLGIPVVPEQENKISEGEDQ